MPRRNRYADREPSVAELLADPVAEALMRADGITIADVFAWIGRRGSPGLPSPAVAVAMHLAAPSGRADIRKPATPPQAAQGRMTGAAA